MLEGRESEAEREIKSRLLAFVTDIPLVIHLPAPFPCAAVFFSCFPEAGSGVEPGVYHLVPLLIGHGLVPESLWLGTCHDIVAEPFQFLEIAAVKQLVILPEFSRIFYGHHTSCSLFVSVPVHGDI